MNMEKTKFYLEIETPYTGSSSSDNRDNSNYRYRAHLAMGDYYSSDLQEARDFFNAILKAGIMPRIIEIPYFFENGVKQSIKVHVEESFYFWFRVDEKMHDKIDGVAIRHVVEEYKKVMCEKVSEAEEFRKYYKAMNIFDKKT